MIQKASHPTLQRSVVSLAASNLVSRGIGLASSLVVAALLSAQDLGVFALAAASAAVLSAICTLGLAPLLTREIAGSADPNRNQRVTGFIFISAGLLVLGVGLLLISTCIPGIGPWRLPGATTTVALLGVFAWSAALGFNTLVAAVFVGHGKFTASAWLGLIRAGFSAVGTVAAALTLMTGSAAACGAAAGEVCALAIGLGWIIRLRWIARPSRAVVRARQSLIPQAASAGGAALLTTAGMWLGQVMLSRADESLVANGLFLLISRLLLIITLIPNALGTYALPSLADVAISAAEYAARRRRIVRLTLATCVPSGVIVAGACLVLLPNLAEEYGNYRLSIAMIAFMGMSVALNNVLGNVAIADGRLRAWILSDWVLAASLLVGAVGLVPLFGLTGLTVTHICAYSASVSVLVFRTRESRRRESVCA